MLVDISLRRIDFYVSALTPALRILDCPMALPAEYIAVPPPETPALA
jgi:hypothetical protein